MRTWSASSVFLLLSQPPHPGQVIFIEYSVFKVDAEASHLGGQKAMQAVKEEVERLQSSCDKLGSELKSVRESGKLTKAQLESSQQNLDRISLVFKLKQLKQSSERCGPSSRSPLAH